jgi:AcrR family transcriptional regulator
MSAPRPLRADAVKNRELILEAAHRQITARGPEVPMEAIAADAGVAVGTLYRHFPTKHDLVAAVVDSHMEQMTRETEGVADRVEAGAPAYDEVSAFARMIMETAAENMAVKAAARALGAYNNTDTGLDRMVHALERILEVGKASGELRQDLTVDDFYLFLYTVPIDQPAPVRNRWFELMMGGFRAPGARH